MMEEIKLYKQALETGVEMNGSEVDRFYEQKPILHQLIGTIIKKSTLGVHFSGEKASGGVRRSFKC